MSGSDSVETTCDRVTVYGSLWSTNHKCLDDDNGETKAGTTILRAGGTNEVPQLMTIGVTIYRHCRTCNAMARGPR